jgi:hypothetical protein
MCIDFTSLNKACPKDNFPLPRIDKIVDSATGCKSCHSSTASLAITKYI